MFQERITKAEVNKLPLLRYEGPIVLVEDDSNYQDSLASVRRCSVFGFDTEKKPAFVKGQYHHVALLQIATGDAVYVFRLNLLGFRDGLMGLFEDSNIKKVGISIRDDIQDLKRMSPFADRNIQEINDLAAELGIVNQGVRNLSGILLKGRISKSQQTSNWENEILTDKQLNYAATDAWVCLEIYTLLKQMGFI